MLNISGPSVFLAVTVLAFFSIAFISMLYTGSLNTMVFEDYCAVTELNGNINVSWLHCTAHGSSFSLDLFMPVLLRTRPECQFHCFL
jgi:hypothetical protein